MVLIVGWAKSTVTKVGVVVVAAAHLARWGCCEKPMRPLHMEPLQLAPPGFRSAVTPPRQLSFGGEHEVSNFKQHGKGFSVESGFRMDFAKEHLVEKEHSRHGAPAAMPVAIEPMVGCTFDECGEPNARPCTDISACNELLGEDTVVMMEAVDMVSVHPPILDGMGMPLQQVPMQQPIVHGGMDPGMHGKEVEKTSEKQLRNSADFYINIGGSFDMLSNVVRSALQNRRKHGGGLLQNLFGHSGMDDPEPPMPQPLPQQPPQPPIVQPMIVEATPPQMLAPLQVVEVIDVQGPDIAPPATVLPCPHNACDSSPEEFFVPQFDCDGTLVGELPPNVHEGIGLVPTPQSCVHQQGSSPRGGRLISVAPDGVPSGNTPGLPSSLGWLHQISQAPRPGGSAFEQIQYSDGAALIPSNAVLYPQLQQPQQVARPLLTGNRIKRLTRLLK